MYFSHKRVKRASMLCIAICKFQKEKVEFKYEEMKYLPLVNQMKSQPNFLQGILNIFGGVL